MSQPETSRTPSPNATVSRLTEGPDTPAQVDPFAVTDGLGGDDILPAAGFTDVWILGGAGNDQITGFAQASVLDGGAGNDTVEGGITSDLYGGAGDDLLVWDFTTWTFYRYDSEFGAYVERYCIAGEDGNDTIRIGNFAALAYTDFILTADTDIDGGAGFDRLETQLVSTEIRVAALEDGIEINGVAVRNIEEFVFADATLDSAQMAALAAAQATTGTDGPDLLIGTADAEQFSGGAGNDWIVPGGGLDSVDGGAGTDMLSFADRTDTGVRVRMETVDFRGYYAFLLPEQYQTPDGLLDVTGIEGVTGTIFRDQITGSSGSDRLRGLDGNDTLEGLGGARDVLDGGAGIDTASYSLAANNTGDPGVTVSLLAGRGWYGDAAGDVLIDIENLTGSASYDTLTGDHRNNRLDGGFGTEGDILIGNGGNDLIVGGTFNNPDHGVNGAQDVAVFNYDRALYEISTRSADLSFAMIVRYIGPGAGDGTDTLLNIGTLRFADGDLVLLDQQATDGDDSFYGMFAFTNRGAFGSYDGAHNMLFEGGAGNDTYHAGAGRDTVDGGSGSDWVDFSGRVFDPVVFDLDAGYALSGYRTDLISIENAIGSDYDDTFHGSRSANTMMGGAGDDMFTSSWGGRNVYDGGAGTDTLSYAEATGAITVSLLRGTGWSGQASQDQITQIEALTGSGFDDVLTGDRGANLLTGLAGDDTLIGNAGDDTLAGGAGADVAVFNYDRALYDVTTLGDTTTVTYTGPGAGDGTDTLTGIEVLQFADGDVIL